MKEARERAVALYDSYRRSGTAVPANLKWMAYSAGVRFGDKDDWKFAWEQYTNSKVRIRIY